MNSSRGECICKICDCGRHRCPHKIANPERWGPEVCTEYGQQYIGRESDRPVSCKPPSQPVKADCPLSNVTTNRSDFVAHNVQPPWKMDHQHYEPPTTPMADQTVYRNEFTEKPQCVQRPIKPVVEIKDNGKFDCETTNRTTYVPWDVCAPELRKKEQYKPSKEPFSAINTYRSDYIDHNQTTKMSSCKPPVSAVQTEGAFNSISEQRHSYISHEIEPRQPINKSDYVKSCVPFEDMTTNRHDYVPLENCKPHSLKPPGHRVATDEPFSSVTTNRSDFIAHNSKPPEAFGKEKYVKPVGEMDLRTTYNENFINQPGCKALPMKPPQVACNTEPFDGETSYRQTYKNWGQPSNILHHKEKYTPNTAPFDGQTTSGNAYIAHNIDRQTSCKPPVTAAEQLPFDGQTSYRSEFINKNIPTCPAASLAHHTRSVSPEGYCYDGEDEEGHLHFTKTNMTIGRPMMA